MATLRSLFAWAGMFLLTCLLATILVAGVVLSAGRLRAPLVRLAMPVFARTGLWLTGVRVEITGLQHLAPGRARILVLNHTSSLDFLLFSVLNPPAPCPIGKAEIKWMFPLNLAFWGAGGILVERKDRTRAVASLKRAAENIRERRGTAMISPEGTRSVDGKLAPFKHGPFHLSQQAGAEIVPVVIHGAWALCPPGSITVQPGVVRVEVKPPWPPSTDPPADAEALHTAYLGWLEG